MNDSIAFMHEILNVTPPSPDDKMLPSPVDVADFDGFFGSDFVESPEHKQHRAKTQTTNQTRKGGSIHSNIARLKALRNHSIGGTSNNKRCIVSSGAGQYKSTVRAKGKENLVPKQKNEVQRGNVINYLSVEPKRAELSKGAKPQQPRLPIKPSRFMIKSPESKQKTKSTKSPPNARSIANIVKRRKNRSQFHSIATLSKSAIVVQRFARTYLAKSTLEMMKKITEVMSGIVSLQGLVRRWLVVNRSLKHKSAVKVQSLVRGHVCRKVMIRNTAATVIQCIYRSYSMSQVYISFRRGLISFQGVVRRRRAHSRALQLKNHSAGIIQFAVRAHLMRVSYLAFHRNLIQCQSVARRTIESKKVFKLRLDIIYGSASELSGTYHAAATQIQGIIRINSAKMSYQADLGKLVLCQSSVRRMFAMKEATELKIKTQIEIVLKMREDLRLASTIIQKAYRGYAARIDFTVLIKVVITCQSVVRKKLAMNLLDSILCERRAILNSAAESIQSLVRRHFAVKRAAATLIQATIRRHFAEMHFMLQSSAALKIQSLYRVYAKKMEEVSAATFQTLVLQAALRRRFAKMNYTLQSAAAAKIQSCYWANANKMKEVRVKRNNAATKIQSIVRYLQAFKFVLEIIETTKRRARYQANERVVVTLQACFRGQVVRKIVEYETYFATLIQSAFRRWQATSTLNNQKKWKHAIVKLQSQIRGRLVRCDMDYLNSCAVIIQAAFRSSRSTPCDWHSATVIQSQWRRHSCQVDFVIALLDIVTAQSIVRRWLAMKKLKVLDITDVSNDLLYNSLELSPGEKMSLKEAQTLSLEGVTVQLFESSFEVEVNQLKEEIAKAEEATLQFW